MARFARRGGNIHLMSEELVPEALVERSSVLTHLLHTDGETPPLKLSWHGIKAWMQQAEVQQACVAKSSTSSTQDKRSWEDVMGNLEV